MMRLLFRRSVCAAGSTKALMPMLLFVCAYLCCPFACVRGLDLTLSTTGAVFERPRRLVQAAAQGGHRGYAVVRLPGLQDVRPTRHPEHHRPLHELHLLHHARHAPRGVALGAAGRRHAHIIG